MEKESYISGFVDGEGCFSVSFSLRKKMKMGIEVRPSFSVSQHLRNKEIILFLRDFFKCGGVRFSRRDRNFKYEVRSVKDLITKIIPHFEKYPLLTSKRKDFEIFKQVCKIIYSNHHLSPDGMRKIIELSARINESGIKRYEREELLKRITR
jgi:hypothetical protein